MRFDEFGDFHGRFQADGSGGTLVSQQLSKSVDRQAGEIAQFVEHSFGAAMTGFEEGASEGGVLAAAEMDCPATRAWRTSCRTALRVPESDESVGESMKLVTHFQVTPAGLSFQVSKAGK